MQNNLIFSICAQFLIPLKEAGMKVSISDLLEHWYGLEENEKKILSLARVSYIVTWRKTFKTSRSKGLSDVLLLIRLLFTVPFSKAKLERMFSRLKRVKTNFRCSHSNVWKIF